jgi:hypothetical protein
MFWATKFASVLKKISGGEITYGHWPGGLNGEGYGVQYHFQQYFSYIVAVSFIGGGNQSTQKKRTDQPQVTDRYNWCMSSAY